jgi:hypothetical protein
MLNISWTLGYSLAKYKGYMLNISSTLGYSLAKYKAYMLNIYLSKRRGGKGLWSPGTKSSS